MMKIIGIALMISGYILMMYISYRAQKYWRIAEKRLGVKYSEYRFTSWGKG